jgi:hypothetical protein
MEYQAFTNAILTMMYEAVPARATGSSTQTKPVRNPADVWVRCDDAFIPIISRSLFDKASQKRLEPVVTGGTN